MPIDDGIDPDAAWPWPDSLDAVIAAPRYHTVVFENQHCRLLDTRIPVGDTVPVHTHRWPGVYYTVRFSHFIRRDGQGQLLFDSRTLTEARPPASWLDSLSPHSVENVGDAEFHLVSVEWKA
jgi:hypothetical protein